MWLFSYLLMFMNLYIILQCEYECPHDHYTDDQNLECLPCNNECRVCYGPHASDCTSCYNYKLYLVSFIFGISGDHMLIFDCYTRSG